MDHFKKEVSMKKFFKFFSVFLALVLLATALPVAAYEDESLSEHIMTVDDFCGSEYFTPMTREEYIANKATIEGITYSEAEAIVDQKVDAAIAALPATTVDAGNAMVSPSSWIGDTTVTNKDGTFTIYGRVSSIYTHTSGLKALYYTQAVAVASHYGKTWADCTSVGNAEPYGSGNFQFIGTCSANLISTTQIRLVLNGYFQIAKTIAENSGISNYFSYSTTVGTTTYLRANIYTTHIERSM